MSEITVRIGPEFDPETRRSFGAVMKALGATVYEKDFFWPQDLLTCEVAFADGTSVRVEEETYIGLTISGEESVVRSIVSRLNA